MEPVGLIRPISEAEWKGDGVRGDLVNVLRTYGPGSIAGVFRISAPASREWERLRTEALGWHQQGYWAGLSRDHLSRMVVFASDRRGCALGCDDDGYWFLGPGGAALDAGRTFDELVAKFILGSLHRTYRTRPHADPKAPIELPDAEVGLGMQDVYVTEQASGLTRYLAELEAGRDEGLEGALSAEPLILAYLHTIAGLCSSAADRIADEMRADALDSVLRLARRRVPNALAAFFPAALDDSYPFRSLEVRRWADSRPELGMRGPFGQPRDTAREIGEVEQAYRPAVHWPRCDADQWLLQARKFCAGTSLEEMAEARSHAVSHSSASERFGIVRLLTQLDDARTALRGDGTGFIGLDDPRRRADDAEARLREQLPTMGPWIELAVLAGPPWASVRATRLLRGHSSADFWLGLIAGTISPMPWGADPWTFAEACIEAPIPDALVTALLPALRKSSPIAAILLSSRSDRDDVLDALISHYATIALSSAWTSEGKETVQLTADDPDARAALKTYLGIRSDLPERSLSSKSTIASPHVSPYINPRNGPPFRPGPLGPVTRALVTRGTRRCVEVLRRTVTSTRLDPSVRDEALKGLLAMKAPGTEALADQIEKRWERYWNI